MDHLGVSDHLIRVEDWSARNVRLDQSGQDISTVQFGECCGQQRPQRLEVLAIRHGGHVTEARIFNPLRVANRSVQRMTLRVVDDEIDNLAVGRVGQVVDLRKQEPSGGVLVHHGLVHHSVRPEEVQAGVEHGHLYALAATAAFPNQQCGCHRLGGSERGALVGEQVAHHVRKGDCRVELTADHAGQPLNDRVEHGSTRVRASGTEPAD